jgi:ATP-binding cassette, subfamily B, bacterial
VPGVVAPAPRLALREVLRRFWPHARRFRRWIALVVLLVGLGQAIDTVTIWLFKLVVDDVLAPRDFGPLLGLGLAYAGLALAGGLVSFCDDYLSTWIGERFLLTLRTDLFRHLQSLSLDFFERRRLGDVLSRLTGDVGAIETLVLSGVADALSYGMRIAFFTGALFYLDWVLALVALLVAPLFWLAARRFSRLIKEASREKRRRSGSVSAVAEDSLSNTALVQAYGREEWEVERLHRENLGAFRAEMSATRLKALFSPLIDLFELVGALLVIAIGTWALSQGRLSLGGLLVFLAYLSQLYSPIRGASRLVNRFHSASAAAERIVEVLDQRPSVRESPRARRLHSARGAVRFEGVSFHYPGAAAPALEHLSFDLAPDETMAIVGASGAGKTTLVKLMLRFYDPTAGRVLLDGADLRQLRLDSLRESIALVAQETLVFDGSVRDNIAYGRAGATMADIERAAVAADAHEFIRALPEGYDAQVGQRGRRLSGGQRQRLAIARAMVRDAPLLMLDEPTTGLDGGSAARVMEPMRRLTEGRATIVISHNLATVRHADAILLLRDGRAVERGTHAELLARGGDYARLYAAHRGATRIAPLRPLVRL